MTTQDALERSLLDDARAHLEPTLADRIRVRAQLSQSLGSLGVTTPTPHTGPSQLGRLITSRKGLALLCTVFGLSAGFSAGFLAGRNQPVPFARPIAARPPAPASLQPPAVEPPAVPETAPAVVVAPRPRSAATTRNATVAEDAGADALGEEVALLQRAERAIRSGHSLLALGILRELDERYPKGELVEERRAAQVMARCQSLPTAEAQRLGQAYLVNAPSGVYLERVRQLCNLSVPSPAASAEKDPDPAGH